MKCLQCSEDFKPRTKLSKYCSKYCCNKMFYYNNYEKSVNIRKQYSKDNKDKVSKKDAIYYENNKDRLQQQTAEYASKNKDLCNAKCAKYNTIKMKAAPKWLTKDHFKQIESLYTKAKELEELDGVKRHVDHIVPLQNKIVCGLHVPWNLRVITAKENMLKSNKLIEGL